MGDIGWLFRCYSISPRNTPVGFWVINVFSLISLCQQLLAIPNFLTYVHYICDLISIWWIRWVWWVALMIVVNKSPLSSSEAVLSCFSGSSSNIGNSIIYQFYYLLNAFIYLSPLGTWSTQFITWGSGGGWGSTNTPKMYFMNSSLPIQLACSKSSLSLGSGSACNGYG